MAEGALGPYAAGQSRDPALRTLSREQKRELAALAAAGIASTLFFLVPFLGATQGQHPLPVSGAIVEIAFVAPAVPALPPVRRTVRVDTVKPRLAGRDARSGRVADIEATSTSITAADEAPDGNHAGETTRGPGPLTRALFGDGRYRVQPFPTVDDRN